MAKFPLQQRETIVSAVCILALSVQYLCGGWLDPARAL